MYHAKYKGSKKVTDIPDDSVYNPNDYFKDAEKWWHTKDKETKKEGLCSICDPVGNPMCDLCLGS
jgi:hypothetical protein